MSAHILLIDCEDDKGLIYLITNILYKLNVNVILNDEFVEVPSNHFFMRTEFEGEINEQELVNTLTEVLPEGARIRLNPKKNKEVVVMATKEHHCLGDLLIRHKFNELNANILAVISNHKHLQSLVGSFGIPFHYITHEHVSREEHEEAVKRTLNIYQPDYLILAKYMRILTPEFTRAYPNRMINIHHSFLPAFIGANPYRQAFNRGVKLIGATAHFVNEDLDQGPIIHQEVTHVNHRYSVKDMSKAGKEIEKLTLAKAVQLVFRDRVFVYGNKTVIL